MNKKSAPSRPQSGRPVKSAEDRRMLESLRAHNQVKECDDPDTPLEPGQTHLHVKKKGQKTGYLIEKRKSFF
jgi:hypothetical protein